MTDSEFERQAIVKASEAHAAAINRAAEASRTAGEAAARAIRDKNLSVTVRSTFVFRFNGFTVAEWSRHNRLTRWSEALAGGNAWRRIRALPEGIA